MKKNNLVLASLLCLSLMACGEKPVATPIDANSVDPKYQNPLLNIDPAQFSAVLGECGKVLYAASAPTDETCRNDVKARAAKQGIMLTDTHLNEPLVHDRYQYSTRAQ
ncbi:hypothetical protein [Deefgea sp. CFH1-16]|uniref:hypothetical protein n=1 Tax=Deefgea sp. CFH1-16 TaxID=2675457 RepID=UPI0015F4E282|nr:hypothetical protein [Deefgea sp. CFH1-16]MBM5574914.1 hypothetical protein [Deefgea sp. CFH1-16]